MSSEPASPTTRERVLNHYGDVMNYLAECFTQNRESKVQEFLLYRVVQLLNQGRDEMAERIILGVKKQLNIP